MPPNTNIEDIWFEINKIPLKWQIPFGVLVDNIISSPDYDVPINIIAHFRSYPDTQLIRFKSIDSLKFNYMNSLKEANTIKYGSSKEILNLPTNDTMRLLDIVFVDGHKMFREFWNINQNFLDNNIENIKKHPIKIVFNKTDIILNKPLIINTEKGKFFQNYL